MRVPLLLLIGSLFLNACVQANSDALPPVKEYSPEMQAKAADELDAMHADAVVPVMIADYGVMRAQVRALAKSNGPF